MNSKAGLIIRIVAGMYLVFSGVTLLRQMITLKPSDYVLKSAIAVLFIVVGVWYGYRNIKATYYFVKGETEPKKDAKNASASEVVYNKPEYDESKYRTAPMAKVEETTKSISLEETDLNQKQVAMSDVTLKEDAPKSETENKKAESKKSEIAKAETKKEQNKLVEKPEEQAVAEKKDPVKLAIEIMEDEDKDRMEKEAELMEVDFEEK